MNEDRVFGDVLDDCFFQNIIVGLFIVMPIALFVVFLLACFL